MRKTVAALLVGGLLLGPASLVLAAAMILNSAAPASCSPNPDLTVGAIPGRLTATTSDGDLVTLDKVQLTRAATIISTGGRTPGVGRDGVLIALMAALTESSLRMLANPSAYPESANVPN